MATAGFLLEATETTTLFERKTPVGGGGGSDTVVACVSPFPCTHADQFWGHVPVNTTPSALCLCTGPQRIHPNDLHAKPRRTTLREALHVRHVEGISQACNSAQRTRAPSVQPYTTMNSTYHWTACNSREIHVCPLEAGTKVAENEGIDHLRHPD